jgi:hypothetical protein
LSETQFFKKEIKMQKLIVPAIIVIGGLIAVLISCGIQISQVSPSEPSHITVRRTGDYITVIGKRREGMTEEDVCSNTMEQALVHGWTKENSVAISDVYGEGFSFLSIIRFQAAPPPE